MCPQKFKRRGELPTLATPPTSGTQNAGKPQANGGGKIEAYTPKHSFSQRGIPRNFWTRQACQACHFGLHELNLN
jgi:hypothetical protein